MSSTTSELQKNILATLVYYDILNYPMTGFEMYKYLMKLHGFQRSVPDENKKYSLVEVITELENDSLKKFIEEYNGFYFLKGRKELVEQRIKKNKIANKKIQKLIKISKWLRFAPFVRMIAMTGSLAMKNTEIGSDLDLLIILKKGKIFTGRILIIAITHFLGKRRYADKIRDRACLNHFLTDDSLEISIKEAFLASEYSLRIWPIFGWHDFQEFQEKNEWIKKYELNFQPDEIPNLKFIKEAVFSWRLRSLGEAILNFNFIENIFKKWQLRRIEKNPKTQETGRGVITNDKELLFWPNFEKQGPLNFEKFKEKLGQIGR